MMTSTAIEKTKNIKTLQKEVQDTFGINFERFRNENNVHVKKLENGSFQVEEYDDLMRCKKAFASFNKNKKYDNPFFQVTEIGNKTGELNNVDLTIAYKSVNSVGIPYFRPYHVLQRSTNGYQLFDDILKTNIGVRNILTYNYNNNFIKPLAEILSKFVENHRRLNYYSILKNFLKRQKIKSFENVKTDNQISHKHIKEFLRLIIHKSVPIQLFGNNQNKKKIMKSISDLLVVSKWETFSLMKLVNQMHLSSIQWLTFISSEEERFYMIAKIIKWFFVNYILEILHVQFYITYYCGKRIFIRHEDWTCQKKRFIEELKNKLIPIHQEHQNVDNPPGKMVLIPKSTGIRSIVIKKYNSEKKYFLKKTQYFLQQLYATRYSSEQPFLQQWQDVAQNYRNSMKIPKIMTADISDAFWSINQVLLFNILQSECESMPDFLNFQIFKILNPHNNCKVTEKYCVMNAGLKLLIPSKHLCFASPKVMCVSKKEILNLIRTEIFESKISINDKIYQISNGISQGGNLSPVLSNIYYEHMMKKYFSYFERHGTLSRYVDDICFVTDEELPAIKFSVLIERGIIEYNCHFNPKKTQTNCTIDISKESPCLEIDHLGWKISSPMLEIEPLYRDARTSTNLTKPKYEKSLAFELRLSNLTSLKLTSIVLNGDINSVGKILSIVKQSGMRQASRCFALILSLFNTSQIAVNEISHAIERSNIQIVNKIWRRCTCDKFKNTKLMKPFLHYILWKCYLQIFRKKTLIYNVFCLFFKEKLSKLHCLKFKKQYNKLLVKSI